MNVCCLTPVEDANATLLILGSMPGKASLCAGQYYAHPRNLFWHIMGELVGAFPALPYEERTRVLRSAGIALWDVLESCARGTSLDSDIENRSLVLNNFAAFFAEHPKTTHVYFNGAKADACYRRRVLPIIKEKSVAYARLPSTSPANASMSYAHKLLAWRAIVKPNKST
jgi:double-stranded uracil-DNA glycosylase